MKTDFPLSLWCFGNGSRRVLVVLLAGVAALWPESGRAEEAGGIESVRQRFQNPPADARPMMRWWWFGPAVTKAEISRELHAMKDAGIGGVELQSIYPLALDDAAAGIKNLPFLSPEHVDALRHANDEARALGMRVDLTIGSGWPYGGASVPITEAAGRLRVERAKLRGDEARVVVPKMEAWENLLATFLVRPTGEAIDPKGTREITEVKDGAAILPADRAGATEVLFFISSRTKQQVKRPAVGGEGFVLNHYDRAATEAYFKNVGDRLMEAFGDKPPYAVFCDSLECYLSDWTPDLLTEFQKRRGYDLKPYLPALVSEIGPKTEGIRHDWGQTLTELLNERFIQPAQAWAARHHTKFRMQCYGIPPATLSSNRFTDLPEGEGYEWKRLSSTRWATSAGHLYGRPVISSETWTWLHSPSFRATPLDMLAEANLHFLQGVNQLIGHGWPYTAPGAEYPGWRLYAAGAFDEKNPWWIVMPELTGYLQRMSGLLREGQPANDVAIYLPNSDAWAHFRNRQVHMIEALRERIGDDVVAGTLAAGCGFDFFDDDALRETGKVESGALALGAGKYKVVILPNVERMPIATLRMLAEFAKQGGIVVATRRLPEKAPGFNATDAEHEEVRTTVRRLFEGSAAQGHFVAEEKAGLAGQLRALLRPDVELSEHQAEIGFIHRRTRDADVYFLANTAAARREVKATFRVTSDGAEWWDPFVGAITPAATATGKSGAVTLPLTLDPYESRVVVFSQRKGAGPEAASSASNAPAPIDLSEGWKVSFEKGATVTMDKLRLWTDDEATRFFSGLATYEKTFDVPQGFLQPGARVEIDFGPGTVVPSKTLTNGMRAWIESPVREAAVVYVNGERAGGVWRPPYRLDVTRWVRSGANQLRIAVGNTAINTMSGHLLPDYKALNQRYGERFKPQDMDNLQPLPSGITGPVRIIRSSSAK